MRRAWLKAIAAAAAVALAASAQAQKPQFIEAGKTVTVKASKAGEPDIYSFLGISGSRVTISLNSAGNALLTLYTPRGVEMLHASGTGTVRLEAVLPLHNIFLVGVSREDSMKGYTLSLSATEPDVHEAYFAEGTGFRMPDFDPVALWISVGAQAPPAVG